jgi:hypothetical protein
MKVWVVLVLGMAFLAGCGSNETNDNEKRGPANEETRFVTQIVTVEETTVATEAPTSATNPSLCSITVPYIGDPRRTAPALIHIQKSGRRQDSGGPSEATRAYGHPDGGTRKPTPKNRDW